MKGLVLKTDAPKRRVYGIALVAGEVDLQGDLVTDEDLEDAAIASMREGISARLQHDGVDRGTVVASWPMTAEIAAGLGFTLPQGKGLWLVGLEFSPEAWSAVAAMVAQGAGLSIGGTAERSPT